MNLNNKKFRQAIYKAHKGYCFWTGQKIDSIEDMDVDHIQPKSKGGTNDLENLVCSHKRVNRVKNDRNNFQIDRMVQYNKNCFVPSLFP